MKVKWMPLPKRQLRQVAKYIRNEFGKKVKDDFLQEVREMSRLIGRSPNVGIVEPLLADRPVMYRSCVVNHLSKIVYCIKDDHIEVAAFWDVRRDPGVMAREVK